jgi:hypothetical protein
MEKKYLIIYDATGYIISQMAGDVREPIGIPFIWIEVPEGKRIISINPETNEPIFEDLPVPEIQQLKEQIAMQEQAILELSMMIGGGN